MGHYYENIEKNQSAITYYKKSLEIAKYNYGDHGI